MYGSGDEIGLLNEVNQPDGREPAIFSSTSNFFAQHMVMPKKALNYIYCPKWHETTPDQEVAKLMMTAMSFKLGSGLLVRHPTSSNLRNFTKTRKSEREGRWQTMPEMRRRIARLQGQASETT